MNNIINNVEAFDPKAWAGLSSDNKSIVSSVVTTQVPVQGIDTDREQISSTVNLLVSRGIDITSDYGDWLKLGFALADALGEEGRGYYHDLSRMNSGYNTAECDKQYNACLRSHGRGVTIKTFFLMAKDAGIDIAQVAKDATRTAMPRKDFADIAAGQQALCANNANVPGGTNTADDVKTGVLGDLGNDVPSDTLAQVAQIATFSDKLNVEDLPSFLQIVLQSQDDAVGRDKMLLATLNLISGALPKTFYAIYDRRVVYAPLYNIIYGRFATAKGDIEACKHILSPIKAEMRREYEAALAAYEVEHAAWEAKNKRERGPEPKEPIPYSLFVSANSSASAVYRTMEANGGMGIMYETEADTLTIMLSRGEYGDYTDLLRKAHHHEACSMVRVTDHINIELEHPRLSILLTCTGSQLPLLLPPNNIANGLASRFLFYGLPDAKVEFRDVFAGSNNPIEDTYKDLGVKFKTIYDQLKERQHRLQFVLSDAQQKEFLNTFNEVLQEQFGMLGNGIQGFVYRIALECYRYAMILSILRKNDNWDDVDWMIDEQTNAICCDDRDFRTAMTIIECLVNHTARVYNVLCVKDNDPFAKLNERPSEEHKKYFNALPCQGEFKTADAMDVAKQIGIAERTAKRMLGDFVTKYMVLDHPKHGVYMKSKMLGK